MIRTHLIRTAVVALLAVPVLSACGTAAVEQPGPMPTAEPSASPMNDLQSGMADHLGYTLSEQVPGSGWVMTDTTLPEAGSVVISTRLGEAEAEKALPLCDGMVTVLRKQKPRPPQVAVRVDAENGVPLAKYFDDVGACEEVR